MKRSKVIASAARLALALCALGACLASARAAEVVRINGAGSSLDVMQVLMRGWTPSHPDVRVEMNPPLGSAGAMKALLAGALDLAVIGRPVASEEEAQGAIAVPYGQSPLLVVGHPRVPVEHITTAQLGEIYSGRLTRWPSGETIRVILRPVHETNSKLLAGLSPAMAQAVAAARRQPWALVAVTDPESNEMVAKTPGAIGMASLASVRVEGRPLRILTLDGVAGTPEALAQGRYPLAKPIVFVTTRKSSPAVRTIVEHAFSAEGRALAAEAGVWIDGRGAGGR